MKTLTPEKAGRELARVMEQVRREREELADATKERKGHIAALEKRARELVDIANGRAHVQLEADLGDEVCGACGKRADEPSKGCDECDHGKPRARWTTSKKFPLGSGIDERCTKCGRPFGDHAGQSCPKLDTGGRP